MPVKNIKSALNKLHASLEEIENPDQELMTLLKQLDDDIHQIIIKDRAKNNDASLAPMEKIRSIGAKFAADHPHLDPILRELADTLGKMGV